MKAIPAATAALLALAACESVPTAAENECRVRHNLTPGTSVYADCVENLRHSEHELRTSH